MPLLKSANLGLHISENFCNVQAQSLNISLGARSLNHLALTFKLGGRTMIDDDVSTSIISR